MKSYIKSIPLKTELPYPDYWEQPMVDPNSVIKPKYCLRVLNGQRHMHSNKVWQLLNTVSVIISLSLDTAASPE